MNVRPADWTRPLALGRLYGLAGEIFRDEFSPLARAWADSWETVQAFGAEFVSRVLSGALLHAMEEARRNAPSAAAERSRLLLLGDCPAYETAYAHPFSRQRELADISGFYRAFGVQIEGERPDHLAVECEFASLLCTKEAIAGASGREEERVTTRRARASILPPSRTAAITPSGKARQMLMNIAASTSSREAGRTSAMSARIGRCVNTEVPRSPRTRLER